MVCGVTGRRIIQTIKGIPTLFIETQHGFARYDTPGDPWGNFVREYFDTHQLNILVCNIVQKNSKYFDLPSFLNHLKLPAYTHL